ncbi:flagellar assembly protein FliW [Aromatoleum toluclasticum]|uniref:flagellar assembly protein FliW n=1 Tax=Aromatoleum toluclasticum TaxID=92003 RepID=UPI001D184100|nr:flagellar assembly protein FliW [Aromatoleum toluclasticum]MCC4114162.1 flagellar assembly protein FliW [Aromatoleum toluclasticum]
MKIESQVFGSVDIPDDKVIEFPAGLPGFEECRNFALVHEDGSTASLFQLQSLDNPAAVFSITGAERLGVNYEFGLSDDEVAQLKLTNPAEAFVAVIVRKDEGEAGNPATAGMRANFMAPLVINVSARRGIQKVITRLGCDVTLRAEG